MTTSARVRGERIEFRTTPEVRELVERAVAVTGGSLTDFAESSVVTAARRVLADRDVFFLSEDAHEEWEAINARPARDLPGLRQLAERPSPFED